LKVLYLDCFSGASGDMILGALLDAGVSERSVRETLDGLGLEGWGLQVSEVLRGGLRSTRACVTAEEGSIERTHRDIASILEASSCDQPITDKAKAVFAELARAEGRIHGQSPDEVHFHEVGGLDAIVDIVGCCAAFEQLSPIKIVTSPIATGAGTVHTAHGVLPLPAPAVTELLQTRGAPLVSRGDEELITPTGAALLTVFTDTFGPMPAMTLERTGYGAGAAERDAPNVLRTMLGELMEDGDEDQTQDDPILIETNLDDMTPELVPYIIDSLLDAGAHDAWITPIVMKKGRPGFVLSVLCDPITRFHMLEIIFRETTTLGVRIGTCQRTTADRRWIEVNIEDQTLRVKIGSRHDDVISISPEFEDVVAAARITGMPAKEIYSRALEKAREQLAD
jgi:uncharacterized protein (TIGR00299 family) protein